MKTVAFAEKILFDNWLTGNNYFDDLAVFSFGVLHPGGIDATNYLINHFNWESKNVLDIGIGNGTTIKFLNFLGANCVGVEKSPFMVTSAIKNGVDPKMIHNLPIEEYIYDKKFDYILIEGVIGFLENPVKVLSNAYNSLKRGGVLFINDWLPFRKTRRIETANYFSLFGNSNPETFIKALGIKTSKHDLKISDTISKSITTKNDEIYRRVELFFGMELNEEMKETVRSKIKKMKWVLGRNTPTKHYLLAIEK